MRPTLRGFAFSSNAMALFLMRKFFDDPQFRAATAWVGGDFVVTGDNWLARHQPYGGLVPAHADRHLRRANTVRRRQFERVFDDAVFETVKADDAETTAGTQQFNRGGQGALDHAKLVVNGDSQRLKNAGRRVDLVFR